MNNIGFGIGLLRVAAALKSSYFLYWNTLALTSRPIERNKFNIFLLLDHMLPVLGGDNKR